MRYPENIRSRIVEVEEAIHDWPVEIDINSVIKWILQFDEGDYDLALRIVKNLNVIGAKDLEHSLEVAYSKLMRKAIEKGTFISNRNTIFAGMGEDGKSGTMISYHFRLINDLSEENFLNDESVKYFEDGMIENIVLIDDVLSSGTQATREIHKVTEKFVPLGVKNIFVLTVCGFKKGIEKVEEETKAHVFSAFEYGDEDTVISLDSKFYEGITHDQRKGILERLKHYGAVCSKKMPIGYEGIGALLVFYYNTPNTTLPIVWGSQNGWIPLFRRVSRINGIESYYKQISNRLKPEAKEKLISVDELTIYTEGKIEEIIFDMLISDFNLPRNLNYKKVSVVSLGGGFHSKKLFEKLKELNGNMLFVFDADIMSRSKTELLEKFPVVYLKPSYLQVIDLIKVSEIDERFTRYLDRHNIKATEVNQILEDGTRHIEIERYFRERLLRSNSAFGMRELLSRCINNEGYENFLKEANKVLKKE